MGNQKTCMHIGIEGGCLLLLLLIIFLLIVNEFVVVVVGIFNVIVGIIVGFTKLMILLAIYLVYK